MRVQQWQVPPPGVLDMHVDAKASDAGYSIATDRHMSVPFRAGWCTDLSHVMLFSKNYVPAAKRSPAIPRKAAYPFLPLDRAMVPTTPYRPYLTVHEALRNKGKDE